MTRRTIRGSRTALGVLAAAVVGSASLLGGTGDAAAAQVTGWVGPAGTTGYLHTSTIINSPALTAQSKIYHSFGQSAPDGTLGVRPRLFKSGALCQAIDYQYNFYTTPELTAETDATCGTGSYNSHGFVAVWNPSSNSYSQYVTFPSNPLNWTAPATARSASKQITDADRKSGTNAKGQRFGSAATADEDQQANLDLILAIGTNGETGYVKSADLNKGPASSPSAAKSAAKPQSRDIALWNREGTERIGTFSVG